MKIDETKGVNITVLTFGSVDARLKRAGQMYQENLDHALDGLNVNVEAEFLDIADVHLDDGRDHLAQVIPLYRKFGKELVAVLFLDGEMVLKGGVASPDLLRRLIVERS